MLGFVGLARLALLDVTGGLFLVLAASWMQLITEVDRLRTLLGCFWRMNVIATKVLIGYMAIRLLALLSTTGN